MIEGWKKQGAEISFFSPLNDEPPSKSDDMVWLPGGYPELYLGRLSECKNFKNGLIDFSKKGQCTESVVAIWFWEEKLLVKVVRHMT